MPEAGPAAPHPQRRSPDGVTTLVHPGGATSELRVFLPASDSGGHGNHDARAAILVLPGIAVGASYYDVLCQYFADRGFVAATTELPGQGTSSHGVGHGARPSGYHSAALEDIPTALSGLREFVREAGLHAEDGGEVPMFLLGHSQGGQLAAYYLARNDGGTAGAPPVSGLVGVATQSPYFKGFGKKLGRRLLFGSQILPVVGKVRGSVPETYFGGTGSQPTRRIADWAKLVRSGKMNPLGADIDYPAGMAASRTPVLAVTIEGDREAPAAAARNWLDFFPAAPRTMRHIPQSIGHNRWARTPEPVGVIVEEWIGQQLTEANASSTRR